MKAKKIFILTVSLLISGQAMSSIRVKPVKVRPVEITILDPETKKPIPEVVFYYHVESSYFKSFLGIPSPFSVYRRDLVLKKYKTDIAGRAFIPAQKVWIKPFHEAIDSVEFYINFDFEEEKSQKRRQDRFNKATWSLILDEDASGILLNERYKTFVLSGYFFEEDEVVADSHLKKKLIDNPDVTLVYRRETINYGSRREKSKKGFIIELPKRTAEK